MASPEEMKATMVANLKDKTGKTLPQWLKLVQASSFEKHGQIVKFLKADHGVSHGFANLIAHQHLHSDATAQAPSDLTATQYSGKKESLRLSLRRNKQFALIQPSTATRVDVGLNLKGVDPKGRLEASGSFNSMCSPRVRLESLKDVNAELGRWLKQAYDQS